MTPASEERNYFVEAKMILCGLTGLLCTVEHLRAIEEHYECRLIRIAGEIEEMKKRVLNGH